MLLLRHRCRHATCTSRGRAHDEGHIRVGAPILSHPVILLLWLIRWHIFPHLQRHRQRGIVTPRRSPLGLCHLGRSRRRRGQRHSPLVGLLAVTLRARTTAEGLETRRCLRRVHRPGLCGNHHAYGGAPVRCRRRGAGRCSSLVVRVAVVTASAAGFAGRRRSHGSGRARWGGTHILHLQLQRPQNTRQERAQHSARGADGSPLPLGATQAGCGGGEAGVRQEEQDAARCGAALRRGSHRGDCKCAASLVAQGASHAAGSSDDPRQGGVPGRQCFAQLRRRGCSGGCEHEGDALQQRPVFCKCVLDNHLAAGWVCHRHGAGV